MKETVARTTLREAYKVSLSPFHFVTAAAAGARNQTGPLRPTLSTHGRTSLSKTTESRLSTSVSG